MNSDPNPQMTSIIELSKTLNKLNNLIERIRRRTQTPETLGTLSLLNEHRAELLDEISAF